MKNLSTLLVIVALVYGIFYGYHQFILTDICNCQDCQCLQTITINNLTKSTKRSCVCGLHIEKENHKEEDDERRKEVAPPPPNHLDIPKF